MHLVNDRRFIQEDAHGKSLAKTENGKPGGGSCGACHGQDHLGTVLSRVPVTRVYTVEGGTRTVQTGKPVACNACHSLSKSFGIRPRLTLLQGCARRYPTATPRTWAPPGRPGGAYFFALCPFVDEPKRSSWNLPCMS